ncbi:MAG TPA: response regulator, partial [Desulforhopalus sp.]|nr:response regulator [Desulforhopalus sp.]
MTTPASILLIDDEESMRVSVDQWLSLSDYRVLPFSEAEGALARIDPWLAGVVVSDIRMPVMDGMALLQAVLKIDPEIPVVLITGQGDIRMAVA